VKTFTLVLRPGVAATEPAANLAQLARDSISGILASGQYAALPGLFSIRQWIEDRAELATSVNGRGNDDLV